MTVITIPMTLFEILSIISTVILILITYYFNKDNDKPKKK